MPSTSRPLPSRLSAAIQVLSTAVPLSSVAAAQLTIVASELPQQRAPLPASLGACLQATLGAFDAQPSAHLPGGGGGVDGVDGVAAATAAAAVLCTDKAAIDGRVHARFLGRGTAAAAARGGVYALVARAARVRGARWAEMPMDAVGRCGDVVCSSLFALCNLITEWREPEYAFLLRECFDACHGALAEVLRSDCVAMGKTMYAAYAVEMLAWPDTTVGGGALAERFVPALLACVVRCGEKEEMRPLLQRAVFALFHVIALDPVAAGLEQSLRSGDFGRVMLLLQRQLLSLSLKPEDEWKKLMGYFDPRFALVVDDANMANALMHLIDALHSCPRAWAAAAALRKKKSPCFLVALSLHMPPLLPSISYRVSAARPAAAEACDILKREVRRLQSTDDAEGWERFIKLAFISDGCYAELRALLQRPNCPNLWTHGSKLLMEVMRTSSRMHRSHGVAIQIRPADDKLLLAALVANVVAVTPRIAKSTGKVQYDDVFAVSRLLSALADLAASLSGSPDFAGRLVVCKVGATKASLRALIAINALTPLRIVGFVPGEEGWMPPTSDMLILARTGLLSLLFKLSTIPSELIKFLAVPGSVAAVVASTRSAYRDSISGCHTKDIKSIAHEAFENGLDSLGMMATNDEIGTLILLDKRNGGDVIKIAREMIADSKWPLRESNISAPDSLTFLLNISLAGDPAILGSAWGAVGRECAGNERFVKGILRLIAVGEKHEDFTTVLNLLYNFVASFKEAEGNNLDSCLAGVMITWHKVGVFAALPQALLASRDSLCITGFYTLASLVATFCGSMRESNPGHWLGFAPMQDLANAGIQRLLDRPGADEWNVRAADMLRLDFSSLGLSNSSTGGSAGCSLSIPQRAVHSPSGPALTADEFIPGHPRRHVVKDDSPGHRMPMSTVMDFSYYGETGKQNDLTALRLKNTTRRHWVCSNPDCGSVDSETVRLKHCRCGVARYCSQQCQRSDWKIHKISCALRSKK